MKFSVASLFTTFVAMASAFTEPDTTKPPLGNPIYKPGLNEQVPVGKPYTITWDPTTPGKVSIQLLRGPSTNVKPIALLADAIPNTGKFDWTPSTSLENDVTHYGLRIIVEGTGQYQWSTQFGIKNDNPSSPPPSSSGSSDEPSKPTETPCTTESSSSSATPSASVPVMTLTTTFCPEESSTASSSSSSSAVKPTGTGNVVPTSTATSYVTPTLTPSPSVSVKPTAPPFDSGAGRSGIAIGGAIGALVAFFAL